MYDSFVMLFAMILIPTIDKVSPFLPENNITFLIEGGGSKENHLSISMCYVEVGESTSEATI